MQFSKKAVPLTFAPNVAFLPLSVAPIIDSLYKTKMDILNRKFADNRCLETYF